MRSSAPADRACWPRSRWGLSARWSARVGDGERRAGTTSAAVHVSVRATTAAQVVPDGGVAAPTTSQVQQVARQAVCNRMAWTVQVDGRAAEQSSELRLAPTDLPVGWSTLDLDLGPWGRRSAMSPQSSTCWDYAPQRPVVAGSPFGHREHLGRRHTARPSSSPRATSGGTPT